MPDAIDLEAFKRFEAAGWGRASVVQGYQDLVVEATRSAVEPLLEAAAVTAGQRVLDVASGPGIVAAAAARRGAQPVGVDVSPAMVELAAQLHPGLDFRLGDAEALDLPEASFDAVVSNFGFLHLAYPERAAGEFQRVLRPGGRIALSVWDVPARMRVLGALMDAVAEAGAAPPADVPPGPPMFRFADEGEFEAVLRGAGFGRVKVASLSYNCPVAGAEQLWDGLLRGSVRTAPLVASQTAEVRQRIRDCFEQLLVPYRVGDHLEVPAAVKLASGVMES